VHIHTRFFSLCGVFSFFSLFPLVAWWFPLHFLVRKSCFLV
jgi:hypothetical protein